MTDTSSLVSKLRAEYATRKTSFAVNFRELTPWLPYNAPRFTHQIHSYPAKVIPQIPHLFLNASNLLQPNSLVFDPFGGSGTVGLEACLSGHDVVLSDSNPLARLLARVKLTPLRPSSTEKAIYRLRKEVALCRCRTPPDVVNIEYWYHHKTIYQLSRIAASVAKITDVNFKELAMVALSTAARRLSLADPRVSVPVRINPKRFPKNSRLKLQSEAVLSSVSHADAIDTFFDILAEYSTRVATLWPSRNRLGKLRAICLTSLGDQPRSLSQFPDGCADLILTSPPYLGAQKYVRASSLSLGWLSLVASNELRSIEGLSIGREHFYQREFQTLQQTEIPEADRQLKRIWNIDRLRAHIASQYLTEMRTVLETCHRLLKDGATFILITGSNVVCGEVFPTTRYLDQICKNLGLINTLSVTDAIRSRGLMTRRNKTASMIPLETVATYQKG